MGDDMVSVWGAAPHSRRRVAVNRAAVSAFTREHPGTVATGGSSMVTFVGPAGVAYGQRDGSYNVHLLALDGNPPVIMGCDEGRAVLAVHGGLP